MSENRTMGLPSGVVVVRKEMRNGERWYAIHGTPVLLTPADVEALFADSIAGDGRNHFASDDDGPRCTDPRGHVWHEGPPDRCDEGPIRCIHCGADGDA